MRGRQQQMRRRQQQRPPLLAPATACALLFVLGYSTITAVCGCLEAAWVELPTIRVFDSSTRPSASAWLPKPQPPVTVAAMRGERETRQLAIRLTPNSSGWQRLQLALAMPADIAMTMSKVVALYAPQSNLVHLPGGHYPDALIPIVATPAPGDTPAPTATKSTSSSGPQLLQVLQTELTLETNATHIFWLHLTVAGNASAGLHNGTLTVTCLPSGSEPDPSTSSQSVPALLHSQPPPARLAPVVFDISLEVWPLPTPVPPTAAPFLPGFNSVFNFFYRTDNDGATDLRQYYGNASVLPPAIKTAYFDFLCSQMLPADDLYIRDPRPWADYTALSSCGAPLFALLDAPQYLGGAKLGTLYTQAQIDSVIQVLAPRVANLTRLGLLDHAYVCTSLEQSLSTSHPRLSLTSNLCFLLPPITLDGFDEKVRRAAPVSAHDLLFLPTQSPPPHLPMLRMRATRHACISCLGL